MCGIVGYIGENNAVDVILEGLGRLEYRGYDSAGISVIADGSLDAVRSVGKLAALKSKLETGHLSGPLGIGHTRWATHGVPSEANAHPHHDDPGAIAVVHNGIIENYMELGAELREKGVVFRSETDTETIAHLIRNYFKGDLFAAVKRALLDIRGAYAIGVVCKDNPEVLIAARNGSPLVIGLGDGENFIASDAAAILNYTRDVIYLEDGHVCEIRRDGYTIHDLFSVAQKVEVCTIDWDRSEAERGGYPHYMLKEIHEQPDVLRNVIGGRIAEGSTHVIWEDDLIDDATITACSKILIVACGTAWHAGLVGKRLIESLAKIPVEIDIASEFRYRDLLVPGDTIVIPVTQSGETADTLEALRIAKRHGARVLSLVNVTGSTIARESDAVIPLRAGLEIGVASTKAYTAMIAAMTLLAVHFGRVRGTLNDADATALLSELQDIPNKIEACLEDQGVVLHCAADERFRDAHSALFLGRAYNLPTALEGALKLKEISYIHAEGYGAGEMKHGAIALVTDKLPAIFIAPRSLTYEKVISNIQEVRARKGIVLAVATQGDTTIAQHCDEVIYIPDCPEPLSPILAVVPLQLLAYYISVNRGCDVDQPRNLAKSVTVE